MAFPDWVHTARRPQDLQRAADYLRGVNSLEAVPPLARLSRVAPGWLFIEIAAILVMLLSIAVLVTMNLTLALGIWGMHKAFEVGLSLSTVTLRTAWFGTAAGVGMMTLIRDTRLHKLIIDARFNIEPDNVTWLWGIPQ